MTPSDPLMQNDAPANPSTVMREVRTRVYEQGPSSNPSSFSLNGSSVAGLPADLAELISLADVDVPRQIRSHRPLFGWYVRLRRWIHRELRLTLDPVLARQVALNRALVHLALEQRQRLDELESRLAAAGAPAPANHAPATPLQQ